MIHKPYNAICKCGEKVSASTLKLLQYAKKENIINHGKCKIYKRHQYIFVTPPKE